MLSPTGARRFLSVFIVAFFLCVSTLTSQAQGPYEVAGRVFRDIGMGQFDGVRGSIDPGVGGVIITAFNPDGTIAATATSLDFDCRGANNPVPLCTGVNAPARGTYTLNLLPGPYRLEMTLIRGYQPGVFNPSAGGSATSVQYVTVGAANIPNINFALEIATDFCEPNPELMLPCYVNGDPLTRSVPPDDVYDAAVQNAIVAFPYNTNTNLPAMPPETELALGAEVGTIWGMAYQRESQSLLAAAVLKRHAGLGPGGLGQIYLIPYGPTVGPGAPQLFVNVQTQLGINVGQAAILSNAARGIVPNGNIASTDGLAFSQVGKVGIGDMDMSDDGQYLWFTNVAAPDLGLPEVHRVFIGLAPTVPTPADVTNFDVPNPGCVLGVPRSYGLEFARDMVYVGVVCTAELGGTAANLSGHIYELDPLTGAGNFIANFPLNYPRGETWEEIPGIGAWEPWTDVYSDALYHVPPDVGNGRRAARPQPIISDIEFDIDGSIIVGILDRAGHQLGMYNDDPDPTVLDDDLTGSSGGDIVRVCFENGTYVLENNAACPGQPATAGAGNGQGPGGGEFYFAENYNMGIDIHQETTEGGLAFLIGRGEITVGVMDPEAIFSGGVSWFSNTNGSELRDVTLFQGVNGTRNTPGKTNGIGDIELRCQPAPLEIGNYVWIDTDQDGIQDPDEVAIPGVVLELLSPTGTVIATATTDAQGRYLFSSGADPIPGNGDEGHYVYNIAGLTRMTNGFQVRANLTQPTLLPYMLTVGFNDPSNNGVLRDSNGVMAAQYATMTVNTGPAGANNHTYDMGFFLIPPTATPTASPTATGTPTNTPTATFTPGPSQTPSLTPTITETPGLPGAAVTATASGTTVTLLKSVSRMFARPGQDVSWTLTVTNTTSIPTPDVSVTDVVPTGLTITGNQASLGTVSISGHTVNWTVGTLQPGQTATLTLTTIVNDDVPLPFRIINQAQLNPPYSGISRVQILSITSLPNTGEIPWWADIVRGVIVVLIGLVCGLGLYQARKFSLR